MFFIVRCIFWLSLVYLNLPGGSTGDGAARFLDVASAHVGSFAQVRSDALARHGVEMVVARAADTIVDNGAEWCRAHGEACADAVLTSMIAKPLAAPTPAKSAPVADTLTPADKSTRWRGPGRS